MRLVDHQTATTPLYARVLRLRHIHPGPLACFALFEGTVAVATLLVLAELTNWLAVLVLPLAVAAMVKLNDVVAGITAPPFAVVAGGFTTPQVSGGSHVGWDHRFAGLVVSRPVGTGGSDPAGGGGSDPAGGRDSDPAGGGGDERPERPESGWLGGGSAGAEPVGDPSNEEPSVPQPGERPEAEPGPGRRWGRGVGRVVRPRLIDTEPTRSLTRRGRHAADPDDWDGVPPAETGGEADPARKTAVPGGPVPGGAVPGGTAENGIPGDARPADDAGGHADEERPDGRHGLEGRTSGGRVYQSRLSADLDDDTEDDPSSAKADRMAADGRGPGAGQVPPPSRPTGSINGRPTRSVYDDYGGSRHRSGLNQGRFD